MALLRGLAAILAGIRDLGANGLIARTSSTTVQARTITGTADQVVVVDGDGVSGNPTLSTPQDIDTAADVAFGSVTAGDGATGLGGELQARGTTAVMATLENTGNGPVNLTLDGNRTNAGNVLGRIRGAWDGNLVAYLNFHGGGDNAAKDDGEVSVWTSDDGSTPSERARFVQEGGLFISNKSGNPTARAGKSAIFAKDVASSSEMFVMDEAGNVTQLSTHDPDTGKRILYSENIYTGDTHRVELEDLIADLEAITGKTYVTRGRLDASAIQASAVEA